MKQFIQANIILRVTYLVNNTGADNEFSDSFICILLRSNTICIALLRQRTTLCYIEEFFANCKMLNAWLFCSVLTAAVLENTEPYV